MTEHKFELIDDYTVKYDGDYFDLHKPSDIRSLVTVANYIVTEIQQIKKDTDRIAIKLHKDCDEVYYENQKLKQEIQQLKRCIKMTERLEFIEVEHEWGTTHHFEYKGNRIQECEVAEMFNELYKENEELKSELEYYKALVHTQ